MAVFEKKIRKKVYLDDTQALTCVFENTQNIQGHTEYIIRVQRGPQPEKSWHIYKRYNDFAALQSYLQMSGLDLHFPPKKLIGNMDREFIAERQIALENYLKLVLMNPILASSLTVRRFLDPENYSAPFQEMALQHVSMALRSEANYEVVRPLPDIGWRVRKRYFLVKCHAAPRDEKLLAWAEFGPDKFLEERGMRAAFKGLGSVQHPHIEPIEFLGCTEAGCYVARGLRASGTLRDAVCSSRPKLPFIKKYGSPGERRPLPPDEVAAYGAQLLDALGFLREKGLPYGHLHTGNILIENQCVKILDIENGILGLPSYYRPYFVQHKKIQTLEAIDVYCFGHVLYEMTFGQPLHESVCDIIPAPCPPLLRSVLESLLTTSACRAGLPSLADLAAHPFFARGAPRPAAPPGRAHLKLSAHVRDALAAAVLKVEARLREEQRIVRHQKRLIKVQERLSSEGGQRKRKARQEQQAQPSQQPHQQLTVNGKSPERSESPASTSTTTSVGTVTPPSGPVDTSPVPAAPPAPWDSATPTAGPAGPPVDRSALLGSICSFDRTALRHTAAP